jgi:hypothetical protein
LAEKGVGMHHSGMIPILREMTEILFSKGYIKILFATETFAVGINMPTKTVIYTNIFKYDNKYRILHPHEYTQMSGRAGRRGIDLVGNVIHLTNLYNMGDINTTSMQKMMKNTPQRFVSKFKLSFNLIINTIINNKVDIDQYINQSMVSNEMKKNAESYNDEIEIIQDKIDVLSSMVKNMNTPGNIIKEYTDLKNILQLTKKNKLKRIYKQMNNLQEIYNDIEEDVKTSGILNVYNNQYDELIYQKENTINYLCNNKNIILDILVSKGFIENNNKITQKGLISSQIHEVHGLIFADACLSYEIFNNDIWIDDTQQSENGCCMSPSINLTAMFSCLVNIRVPENLKTSTICFDNGGILDKTIHQIKKDHEEYQYLEDKNGITTGFNYDIITYDLVPYIIEWCNCKTESDCKIVLNKLWMEKEISSGDFVKAILKINCIAAEFENIATYLNNLDLLNQLTNIPSLTLKYIAITQSLYV